MHGIKRTTLSIGLAILSLLAMTACDTARSRDLGEAKALIESCQEPVNSYVAIDGTASSGTTSLDSDRRRAVAAELALTAACGGRAKVVIFSSSSAATTTLFEGRIELRGATDQARARRLNAAVNEVTEQITAGFSDAVPDLDPGGSDPVAQMRLFGEWVAQAGEGQSRLLVLTDGFQTAGVPGDQIMREPEAAASRFDVPDLAGTTVRFAGIGEVVGKAPPTEIVDALKTFYAALCQRSAADRCSVITEVAADTSVGG